MPRIEISKTEVVLWHSPSTELAKNYRDYTMKASKSWRGINMPGNRISINDAIKYYVSDKKVKTLIRWLNRNGLKLGDQFKDKYNLVAACKH